eukprot:scaffold2368_cov248-Pinguiococcus_pyrenoidosus.AAC.10
MKMPGARERGAKALVEASQKHPRTGLEGSPEVLNGIELAMLWWHEDHEDPVAAQDVLNMVADGRMVG